MSEVNVPEGYKQTEVGFIPKDWEMVRLEEIARFLKGSGLPKSDISDYAVYPCIHYGQLFTHYKEKISSISSYTNYRGKVNSLSNDILMPTSDVTPNGLATASCLLEDNIILGGDILVIRSNPNILDGVFFSYLVHIYREQVMRLVTGSTVYHLYASDMKNFSFGLPGIEEQVSIRNALSDIDNLIQSLEKLIAKKEAIKTGTMQQLLTGKTRLPEFASREDGSPKGFKQTELGRIPEDWDLVSVDACSSKVGSGKTPTGGSSVYVTSGRPFIRSQNVGWGELKLSDVAYITNEVHQTFLGSEIESSDVLLNITGASIGRCTKADARIAGGNVNQHVCIVRTNQNKLNPKILVELINSDIGQKQIDGYQAGGNREGLNFKQVRQLKFAISDDINEQIAIATILSDIDTEIQALQQRLDKTRDIKQGMMQQLLTGKVRLAH